ncbi:MAG: IS66 family transposase [Thermodesulfobacteriota bacterium]|nr:IS66 family transposase [Thermodesulfobacteriota bacterium]
MTIKDILSITYIALSKLSKDKLLRALQSLREKYIELEKIINELKAENAKLKEVLISQKIKSVNRNANKPSSKQPEWEEKGVGNDGKGKKKRKGRGKKPRKGAGNRPKDIKPNRTEKAKVDYCSLCGKDLSDQEPLKSTNERIIVDIPDVVEKPEVIEIEQEKKYCDECKEVITAKSELALPGADIGLNSTILICYLWVALCLPFTKIRDYVRTFFGLKISTSGLSRHVIRVAGIMKDVYAEILGDINNAVTLHADETGWRVKGKNWWLWVFGTQDSAYFTVDKTRGGSVVRRVLGEIFLGLLVVDGWCAYLKLICEQQSCMAHLLRKIRKFRDAFPHLSDIVSFYVKLRRILRDGERLQANRKKLGEMVFRRRLNRLKARLEDLLNWPSPDHILEEIIKKVKRQQPRILTFVEHPGAPCHNNYGEFLIRIGVLKRKISGGSVSAEGANAYAILLSIHVTCKLRGISFPKYMKESLRHYIRTGKPMSLSTYSTFIADNYDLKKAA